MATSSPSLQGGDRHIWGGCFSQKSHEHSLPPRSFHASEGQNFSAARFEQSSSVGFRVNLAVPGRVCLVLMAWLQLMGIDIPAEGRNFQDSQILGLVLWLYPTNYPMGVWPIPVPTNIFNLQRSGSLSPSLPTQPPGGQQWDPARGQGCRMSLPSPMLPWNCPVQGCEGSGCLPHSGQPVPGRSRPAGTGPTDPGRTCGNQHEPKFPRQRNRTGSRLAKSCPGSLFPLGAAGGLVPEGGSPQ